MTDAELTRQAEQLPIAELEDAVATLQRQLGVAEKILRRRQSESPPAVLVEFTSIRILLTN